MSFNDNINAFYSPSDFPELPHDDLYIDQFFPSDWNETPIAEQTNHQQDHLTSVPSELNQMIPHQSNFNQFFPTPPQTQPFVTQSPMQVYENELNVQPLHTQYYPQETYDQFYTQPLAAESYPNQNYENQFYTQPSFTQDYPQQTENQFYAQPTSTTQYYSQQPSENQYYTQPSSTQNHPQPTYENQFYMHPSQPQPQPYEIHNQFNAMPNHHYPIQPFQEPRVYGQAQVQQQGQHQLLTQPSDSNTLPPGNVSDSTTRSEGPRTFPGVREVSQKGIHKVIVYEIPGSTRSYVFMHKRRTSQENVAKYICVQCKKGNKYTAISVSGDEFLEDPALLSHNCIPSERTKDKADRLSYECLQQVRENPEATLQPTLSYFHKVVDNIETMNWADAEKRTSVMAHYMETNGYESRRSALNRAVKRTVREVTMTNVPEALRNLAEGETFLQVQEPDLHIYMSQTIIRRAVENNLFALVGDGIHKLNPRSRRGTAVRMEGGQVYTVHGICAGGFEIPLLFAITKNKREGDYVNIFNKLKVAIQEAAEGLSQTESDLRIILDFELAAINAAKTVFPSASVQGCAWHLSQAWVRKRNTLGILHFLKGNGRCAQVVQWWRTLKGLPFLPTKYFHHVAAMRTPPVGREHPAYGPCKKFLNYLRNTWLDGPFKTMWCKYGIDVQRTTNSAENYHGRLRKILGKRHPPLGQLILAFRSLTSVAKGTLAGMEVRRGRNKTLRKRDRLRRERVESAMATFGELRSSSDFNTATIEDYLRRMSRYTSDKAI